MPARIDRDEGFTLLELLVIVVVVGVLSTVVAIAVRSVAARGADAACAADARTLAGAVEVFAATHPAAAPPDEAALVAAGLLHGPSSRFDVTAGVVVPSPGSRCSGGSSEMAVGVPTTPPTTAGAAAVTTAPGGVPTSAAAPVQTTAPGGAGTTAAAPPVTVVTPAGPTVTTSPVATDTPAGSVPAGGSGPSVVWMASTGAQADVAGDGTVLMGGSGDTWLAQPAPSSQGGIVEAVATVAGGSPTYYGVVYGAPSDAKAPLSGVVVALDVRTKKLVAEVWWQGARCAKPKESTGLAKGFDVAKPHAIALVAAPGEHGLVVTGRLDDRTTVTIDLADINSGEACRGFQLGKGAGLVVSGTGRVRFEKVAVG